MPHNYGLLVASSGVQVDVALVDVEGALLLPLYNVDQLDLLTRSKDGQTQTMGSGLRGPHAYTGTTTDRAPIVRHRNLPATGLCPRFPTSSHSPSPRDLQIRELRQSIKLRLPVTEDVPANLYHSAPCLVSGQPRNMQVYYYMIKSADNMFRFASFYLQSIRQNGAQ